MTNPVASCPFCNLGASQGLLGEDAYTRVIFSNPRLMPGHLLVIPRRHVSAIWELTELEMLAIWHQLNDFEQKILAAGLGTGCDIHQNYRPFLPDGRLKQSHLHIHLQPRTLEDQLYDRSLRHETPLFQDLTDAERQDLTRRLM